MARYFGPAMGEYGGTVLRAVCFKKQLIRNFTPVTVVD